MEEWKDIEEFDRSFQVSNKGRVRKKTGNGYKQLTIYRNGQRMLVSLWYNKKTNIRVVAELVATAFIPNPFNREYVEHINGDITDNDVENLQWSSISKKEALSRAISNGLYKGSNEYKVDGETVYVKLTNTEQIMLCDLSDWERLKKCTWFEHDGYAVARVNKKITRYHQAILSYAKEYVVDHINRDRFDNRRINLRITTQMVNSINRSLQSNNTSGYVGVHKTPHGYIAYISVNKKKKYLGSFRDINEAIAVRKQAEEKYHKEIIEKETLR